MIDRIKGDLIYISIHASTVKTNKLIILSNITLKFICNGNRIDSQGYYGNDRLILFGAYKYNGIYIEYFHFKNICLHGID